MRRFGVPARRQNQPQFVACPLERRRLATIEPQVLEIAFDQRADGEI
jgi:hypothetical protein